MKKVIRTSLVLLAIILCRQTMAADVAVYHNNDNLIMQSYYDGAPPDIRVETLNTRYGTNSILVTGLNGTTINGSSSLVTPFPAGNIAIELFADETGNLELRNLNLKGKSGDLHVFTNTHIVMDSVKSGSYSDINVIGEHNIDLYNCYARRDLYIWQYNEASRDQRYIFVEQSGVDGDLIVDGGAASNYLRVKSCFVRKVADVNLGAAKDYAYLTDSMIEVTDVRMGSGDDYAFVSEWWSNNVLIDGGLGLEDKIDEGTGNPFPLNTWNAPNFEYYPWN